MALTVGSRLGHYDVTALIGEGGMGQVYQATDTTLNWRFPPIMERWSRNMQLTTRRHASPLVRIFVVLALSLILPLAPAAADTPDEIDTLFAKYQELGLFNGSALVAEGKIDLDAPVTRYLPDYPADAGDRVTIHHLLNHRRRPVGADGGLDPRDPRWQGTDDAQEASSGDVASDVRGVRARGDDRRAR